MVGCCRGLSWWVLGGWVGVVGKCADVVGGLGGYMVGGKGWGGSRVHVWVGGREVGSGWVAGCAGGWGAREWCCYYGLTNAWPVSISHDRKTYAVVHWVRCTEVFCIYV